MNKDKNNAVMLPDEVIINKIYYIREQKVMIDRDLAVLYGVETKALKQAVKRNIERFPDDFMFEMTKEELENWRSQFVTSKSDKKGLRYSPFCFTNLGVAQLSTVLKSKKAIMVNIQIMRVFNNMYKMLSTHNEILGVIDKKEAKNVGNHYIY